MGWSRCIWTSALLWSLGLAGISAPAALGDSPTTRALLADQLLDDARQVARNPNLPTAISNRQALVLLKEARILSPDSPDILRALADVAHVAQQTDLELDAVKNLVRLEPDNLVEQVHFLDLLVQKRQTVEQKIAVCQAAFDSPKLNPQVRSEMAVRLYRLLLQRGQASEASRPCWPKPWSLMMSTSGR